MAIVCTVGHVTIAVEELSSLHETLAYAVVLKGPEKLNDAVVSAGITNPPAVVVVTVENVGDDVVAILCGVESVIDESPLATLIWLGVPVMFSQPGIPHWIRSKFGRYSLADLEQEHHRW